MGSGRVFLESRRGKVNEGKKLWSGKLGRYGRGIKSRIGIVRVEGQKGRRGQSPKAGRLLFSTAKYLSFERPRILYNYHYWMWAQVREIYGRTTSMQSLAISSAGGQIDRRSLAANWETLSSGAKQSRVCCTALLLYGKARYQRPVAS
jgi:hypothetical protein